MWPCVLIPGHARSRSRTPARRRFCLRERVSEHLRTQKSRLRSGPRAPKSLDRSALSTPYTITSRLSYYVCPCALHNPFLHSRVTRALINFLPWFRSRLGSINTVCHRLQSLHFYLESTCPALLYIIASLQSAHVQKSKSIISVISCRLNWEGGLFVLMGEHSKNPNSNDLSARNLCLVIGYTHRSLDTCAYGSNDLTW